MSAAGANSSASHLRLTFFSSVLVTVSSLWNAIFLHRGNLFRFIHVAVRGRDIFRSDQRVHFDVDDVCGRQTSVTFFFWEVVERHFG